MVVAVVWAPNIREFGGLFADLQQAFSILVPPVVAVFLLGVFGGRGAREAAFWTLIAGHVVGIALFIAGRAGCGISTSRSM